ncbi:MBL fold metallo-hydrolase [Marinicrinis lubricantis]
MTSLQITMLGTGSAFSKRYLNNNAMIEWKGTKWLIDCGNTAPLALHALNEPLESIEGVLVTHLHADHVGGLEEIAFRMNIFIGRKPKLIIAEDLVETLWENGLKAGMEDSEHTQLEDYFEVRAVKPEQTFEWLPGLVAELIQTKHIPGKKSYSLKLNRSLFYSADMTFHPELLKRLVHDEGYQYILHECQLTGEGAVHTTLEELLTLPESIQRITMLMHYGDEREQFEGKTGMMTFMNKHELYTFDI